MSASKVYFTNMRCHVGTSLPDKLDKLMRKAGIEEIDFTGKFTAIKLHFGEPGNLSFLRHNYARAVVNCVGSLGGKPFLTDCNTLYVGRRKDALEHLTAANENGFSPLTVGCQLIIGDGLKGTDDVEVPINGGKVLQSAFIGRAIMDADVFISLTHFKGHELTGFGGAIKNIGMGCGSRAGKMVMHCNGKPTVDAAQCKGCTTCTRYCAQDAITVRDKIASIDHGKCVGCGRCIGVCNFNAIGVAYDANTDDVNLRMVEYTKAVLDGRPHFHVSIIAQVSPFCDCHAENDVAIVPDLGMLASFDPVALDQACIDMVNAAPMLPGTALSEADRSAHPHDYFKCVHPITNWQSQIAHSVAIGLGQAEYELITMK